MNHERFRVARAMSGKSFATLGKELGITPTAVYRYEHGSANASSDRLTDIANALGVTVDWLVNPDPVDLSDSKLDMKEEQISDVVIATIDRLKDLGYLGDS